MSYSVRLTRETPSLIVFLLDHSRSMGRTIAGGTQTKAQTLADTVNETLYNLVARCHSAQGTRHYVDVAVLGYTGPTEAEPVITSLLPPADDGGFVLPVTKLPGAELRVEEKADGSRLPVWVEPGVGAWTPMLGALKVAGRTVADWAKEFPRSFPPVVVNVTDGILTDGTVHDLKAMSDLVRSVRTDDGTTLLLNVHLAEATQAATPVVFPQSFSAVGSDDGFAHALFECSSELPVELAKNIQMAGHDVGPASRMFVYNASASVLASILNIGTSFQQPH